MLEVPEEIRIQLQLDLDALREEFKDVLGEGVPDTERNRERLRLYEAEVDEISLRSRLSVDASGARGRAETGAAARLSTEDLASAVSTMLPSLSEGFVSTLTRDVLMIFHDVGVSIKEAIAGARQGVTGVSDRKDVLDTQLNADLSSVSLAMSQEYGQGVKLALEKLGIDVEEGATNFIDRLEQADFIRRFAEIRADQNILALEKDPDKRKRMQLKIDQDIYDLAEDFRVDTRDVGKLSREAGERFADDIRSGFRESFSDLLKGVDNFEDFVKSVLDTFTNSVINAFVDGLLDPLTGEDGVVTNALKNLGTKIFGVGNLFGEPAAESAKSGSVVKAIEGSTAAIDNNTAQRPGLFSTLIGVLSVPFKLIGGLFKAMWDGLKGLFTDTGTGEPILEAKLPTQESLVMPDACACLKKISGRSDELPGMEGGGVEEGVESVEDVLVAGNEQRKGLFATLLAGFKAGLTGLGGLIMMGLRALMSVIGIGGGIGGSFFGDLLNAGAGALWGMFGGGPNKLASGGFVSGPGSGTSDSIPAMLSNGEFVINAKSTAKYFDLLKSLNENKFAAGGLVGSPVVAYASGGAVSTPRMYTPDQTSKFSRVDNAGSEQVFNINITGDVSKQTRKEIITMLPQIAGGVNRFNKEKLRR